jgi:hypothetical protein
MPERFQKITPRGEWLPTVPRDRAELQEHRCGVCYGPYGRSAIPCPNDPKQTPQIAVEHRTPPDLNQLLNELHKAYSERDALRAQLDSMTEEWGVRIATPNVGWVESLPNREACERWIANPPLRYTHQVGEEFSIVRRRSATPWAEVPESEGQN